jgi:hypothetical protein
LQNRNDGEAQGIGRYVARPSVGSGGHADLTKRIWI